MIEQREVAGSSIHLIRARGVLKQIDLDKMFHDQLHGGIAVRRQLSTDILVGPALFSGLSACADIRRHMRC